MTEEEVKAGLRKMAGLTDEAKLDIHSFGTDMRKTLKMDTRCYVKESRFRLENLVINHVADDNLEGVVEEDGE